MAEDEEFCWYFVDKNITEENERVKGPVSLR
jgi:hypothetical protein